MRSSRPFRRLLALAALSVVLSPACSAALFKPPVGPGVPAPEALQTWADATRACHGVTSYKASMRVSGIVGTDHLPTTIGISTGVTADAFRLEGKAAGRNIFRLAGTRDQAQLYIDDGHRLASGRPEELTDALFGVKLDPARWLALVTGCAVVGTTAHDPVRYGEDVAVIVCESRVFVSKKTEGTQIAAGLFDGLQVSYNRFAASLPSRWRLDAQPGHTPGLQLSLELSDLPTTNGDISPDAFRLQVPGDATPMSLEELRDSGPLRRKGG